MNGLDSKTGREAKVEKEAHNWRLPIKRKKKRD